MEFLSFGNPADAVPAIFTNGGEPLQALEVDGNISSFFMSSLFADGEGLVDIVDARDFLGVGAVGVGKFE